MEYIYSKLYPKKILHSIFRFKDIKDGREDLVDSNNFIQCSALKLNEGKTFKPHRHNWRKREWDIIAQESWVILKGKVKCIFYDLNNEIIAEPILEVGDVSFSFGEAAHNYLILEDDTFVYEMKTGKYEGQEIDKTFI